MDWRDVHLIVASLSMFWLGGGRVMQNIYVIVLHQCSFADGIYSVEGHKLAMGSIGLLLVAAPAKFAVATATPKKQL